VQGDGITIAFEAMSSEDRQSIQQLAINVDGCLPTRPPTRDQRAGLASLSQLRCLFAVRLGAWLVWSSITEQEMELVFFRGFGFRGRWQRPYPLGSARNWPVRRMVHIGLYELEMMGGVHEQRAERLQLVTEYKTGRRHLLGPLDPPQLIERR
jgi:hypothetical protein